MIQVRFIYSTYMYVLSQIVEGNFILITNITRNRYDVYVKEMKKNPGMKMSAQGHRLFFKCIFVQEHGIYFHINFPV